MKNIDKFKELYNKNTPFILANVHNDHSAIIFEKLGYKAIGTSSMAIANSLGLEDGEQMTFKQLFLIVSQIIKNTTLPLTVDIEAGYSRDINKICKNIHKLIDIGVVGINIEDSVVENNQRKILDAEDFANIIKKIKTYLDDNSLDLFVNIRTDYYIMGLENPLQNTLERINIYNTTGADGIFIPAISNTEDIKKVVDKSNLPINVMFIPDLPSFELLESLGVKRISMGPFAYNKMMNDFEKNAKNIMENKLLDTLF
jgi:2-methylisocitrate lyase-like PEP mutase family enzyme